MRLHHYLLVFILLAIVACAGRNLPDGVLPAKKMIPFLLTSIFPKPSTTGRRFKCQKTSAEELYLSVLQKIQARKVGH